MNVNKYILVLVIFLFPLLANAQKVGDKYILSTHDTTRIVSKRGQKDPDNAFIFNKKGAEADSVAGILNSEYNSLEGALLDIDKMIGQIEKDQILLKTGNTGLGYRLSKVNVDNRDKEKKARLIADSLQQALIKKSTDEMARKYAEFGDKPYYFINGVRVQPEVINQLTLKDVVKRDLKIQDTASGNPNGEMWITITDKEAERINLFELSRNRNYNEAPRSPYDPGLTYPSTVSQSKREVETERGTKTESKKIETKAKDVKKEKAPRRSVRRIKSDREETKNDKTDRSEAPVYQSYPVQQTPQAASQSSVEAMPQQKAEPQRVEPKEQPKAQQPQQAAASPVKVDKVNSESTSSVGGRQTIVRARTVNNEEVIVAE